MTKQGSLPRRCVPSCSRFRRRATSSCDRVCMPIFTTTCSYLRAGRTKPESTCARPAVRSSHVTIARGTCDMQAQQTPVKSSAGALYYAESCQQELSACTRPARMNVYIFMPRKHALSPHMNEAFQALAWKMCYSITQALFSGVARHDR